MLSYAQYASWNLKNGGSTYVGILSDAISLAYYTFTPNVKIVSTTRMHSATISEVIVHPRLFLLREKYGRIRNIHGYTSQVTQSRHLLAQSAKNSFLALLHQAFQEIRAVHPVDDTIYEA